MLSYFIFALIYIFHCLTVYYHLQIKSKNNFNTAPLKDIIMDNGPDLRIYNQFVHFGFIIFFIPYFTSKNIYYLSEVFKIFSIIFTLRIITSNVTLIPSSNVKCKETNNIFYDYIIGHCTDKIFSGHSTLTLILVLSAYSNNLINYYYFIPFFFMQIIYAILLIFCKSHYSVDVILSYIITIPYFFIIKNNII